jgi:hypothetical protein
MITIYVQTPIQNYTLEMDIMHVHGGLEGLLGYVQDHTNIPASDLKLIYNGKERVAHVTSCLCSH